MRLRATHAQRRLWLVVAMVAMTAVFAGGAGARELAPDTAAASRDTGGYPDWNMQCAYEPHATTGNYNLWCPGYEWGPFVGSFSTRGYGYRNCTDWVAWRLQQLGVPDSKTRGLHNGGEWYTYAPNNGLSRGSTPRYGAAAVRDVGTFGHVAFVEAYDSETKVLTVSEYNKAGTGVYGTRSGTAAHLGFSKFVYFGLTTPPPPPTAKTSNQDLALAARVFTSGDFNGDGFGDLATGVPGEAVGSEEASGAVAVHYGRASGGLTSASNLSASGGGLPGNVEVGDYAGAAVTSGDFNGDGRSDLAVGVPGEDVGTAKNGGAVAVLYGNAGPVGSGFTASPYLSSGTGLPGNAESDDHVGSAVAAGDFNGDGRADLAVGVPGEDVSGIKDAGAVFVLYGQAGSGFSSSVVLTQGGGGMPGNLETGDQVGFALASGDFNHDGRADLAVGVPREDVGDERDSGIVTVLYGQAGSGFSSAFYLHSSGGGLPGNDEAGDHIGAAVATGDVNGDTFADLLIGVPGEDVSGLDDAGAAMLLYGQSSPGFSGSEWLLSGSGIPGNAEAGDYVGVSVAVGDVNGDGFAELAVGAPGEDISGVHNPGYVALLFGKAGSGFSSTRQLYSGHGYGGTVETNDYMGAAVAIADLSGDGRAEVLAGAPSENVSSVIDAGAVAVGYGQSDPNAFASDYYLTGSGGGWPGTAESGDYVGGGSPKSEWW